MQTDKALWQPNVTAVIPAGADGNQIVSYVRQLTARDKQQMLQAYQAGSYEMLTTFVWAKAISAIKRQLSSLGMDFIGEMLGRSDIDSNSSIEQCVTDYDAIRLAEDLGMVNSTAAMRLRHALELITHFARAESLNEENEEMTRGDAENCLRACVQAILGQQQIQVAGRFVEFRDALEAKVFQSNDGEIQALTSAPYFFKRTTLSVLLARIRTAEGAQLSNVLANTNTILPLIWEELRKPEKWQVGETYTVVHAAGRQTAVAGLKKALMRVGGFDFVPENLRSSTFAQAAQKVMEAHDGFQNYYNEPGAIQTLASLGSSIPMPAFPICMRAILCVRLGNFYGHSYAAQSAATKLLKGLSADRWDYFVSECLPGDTRILYKLQEAKPRSRWIELVKEFNLTALEVKKNRVSKFLQASREGNSTGIDEFVRTAIQELGYATT